MDNSDLCGTIRVELLDVSADAADLVRIAGSGDIDVSVDILDAAHHVGITDHAAATLITAGLRGDGARKGKALDDGKICRSVIGRTTIASTFYKAKETDVIAVAVRGGDGHVADGIALTVEPTHEFLIIVAVDTDRDVPIVVAEIDVIDELPVLISIVTIIVTDLLRHQGELTRRGDLVRTGSRARAAVETAGTVIYPIAADSMRRLRRGIVTVVGNGALRCEAEDDQRKDEDENERYEHRFQEREARAAPSVRHADRGAENDTLVTHALCCVFAVLIRFTAFHSKSPFCSFAACMAT